MALALPSAGKPRLSLENTGAFLGSFLSWPDNINIFDSSFNQNFEQTFMPLLIFDEISDAFSLDSVVVCKTLTI